MIVLATAYGLLQRAILDQSLFNPSYHGHDFQSAAPVPALGLGASSALTFVAGHAIWSIGVPIAIVEALVPGRRTTPWLGRTGLAVTGAVFLLGSLFVFQDQRDTERFMASGPQLAGAAAVILALVGIAFAVGRRPGPRSDRRAPAPWLVGAAALVVSGLFWARPESWAGVAFGVGLLAATAVVVSRRTRSFT